MLILTYFLMVTTIDRIDNTSVDRSLATLHTLILRGFRHVAHGRPLLDSHEREQMTFLHQVIS
jgi:hypothetical protein